MSLELETGRYLIYTKDGNPVGYNPSNGADSKLGIYAFTAGYFDILSVWGVERGWERSSQGVRYQLTAYPAGLRSGSLNTGAWPVGSSVEGRLWAYASPLAGESWFLARIGQNGSGNNTTNASGTTFTVTNANGDGWAVDKPSMNGPDSDEKPVHIAVRQLATNPASHPPNEVFIFKKLG
ncbi:hypothetical protein LXA43DRAFT_1063458 [Ganoderma leucocontextum]|nr:hypothetical protein LXA43DRAFT_1063458 [Ganoderma leucocontextum]